MVWKLAFTTLGDLEFYYFLLRTCLTCVMDAMPMTGAHVLLNLTNCATAQAYSEASLPMSIIVNGTKGYDKTSIYLLDICTCKLEE